MSGFLRRSGVSLAVLLIVTMTARAEEDKAKKISLDKAPKAVRDAINNRFPDAEVSSIEKKTKAAKSSSMLN